MKTEISSQKEDENMIELDNKERHIVNSLCEEREEVLIQSALEGSTGHVWMPVMNKPSYCLVQQGDFSYLLGIPPKAAKSCLLYKSHEQLDDGRLARSGGTDDGHHLSRLDHG